MLNSLYKHYKSYEIKGCDVYEKQNILIALNIRLIGADFKKIFKILQFLFPAFGDTLNLQLTPGK